MQKVDLSNLDTLYLMNTETGETIPWEGVAKISADDWEGEFVAVIPQEVADKLNEAAVEVCSDGQKIHDAIVTMLEKYEPIVRDLHDSIMDALPDDKTPNPIYIPKHIQHRKKGRR